MPIYEYKCRGCGNQFELLVLPNRQVTPACPQCKSEDLEQLVTGFAFSSEEIARERVKKARAASVNSKNHKDKQIAEREHLIEHVREHREDVQNAKK